MPTSPPETAALSVLAWPKEGARGNPYTRLLYDRLADRGVRVDAFGFGRALARGVAAGRYDVWHVHWPDGAFKRAAHPAEAAARMVAVLGLQRLLRARGTRVVWTAHNAGGHETRHPQLEAWFWQAFTRRLDGVISLSEAGLREVWQAFPALAGVPSFVVPHGHYRSAYPPPVPRAEARAALDLPAEAPVILHFGVLRPYKNVPHLIDTFGTMVRQREAERGDAAAPVLVVAGRPETEAVARAVQEAAEAAQAASADVRLRLGFVPDADVPPLFAAADLVALPYAEILNSGTALLALSFDRPVLVPARGAMAELRERVGPGFVRTYARALTPETLAAALRWACPPVPPARAALDALGWDRLAAETHAALEAVCSA